VAAVKEGSLSIHRLRRNLNELPQSREITTLKMEIQEIMKGAGLKQLNFTALT